jgi:hypothetical protein
MITVKPIGYFAAVLLLSVFGFSCKSSKMSAAIKSEDKSTNSLLDPEWQKTLEKSKKVFKTIWINDCDPLHAYRDPRYAEVYSLLSTKEELQELEPIPTEVFEIDSASFAQWTPDVPVTSIMKLKKDEAACYLVKEKQFYYYLGLKYENDKWRWIEFGSLFKQFAKNYSELYFDKKAKLIEVYVKTDTHPKGYRFSHSAHIENRTIKVMLFDGSSMLLQDKLAQLRRSRWRN